MPTKIVSTNIAGNVKPCFASSPIAGLTVRCNGEERTKILDMNGNIVDAEFPIGPAPTLSHLAVINKLPENKWAAYCYVYAATSRYPFVENDVAIGGSVAPRGQPSPAASIQIASTGTGIRITAPSNARPDLDQVWFFRTAFFETQVEAETAAAAGNSYFLGAVNMVHPTAVVWDDENELQGGDQVEIDNFTIPTFQFCIYADPYWWGWGNYPLSVQGSWTTGGVLTLTDGTKWFDGRNDQYVRLENIEVGGIGNNGLWYFKWLTATTAQILNADGSNATLAAAGVGGIVVQGPPTTLFRSKARNPFSWGWTELLATGARVPQTYAFKVGGGLGTAIGTVPNLPYLFLSTEYPAGSFTLDLRQAGNTGISGFEKTLRQISNFYSITSHFSQFAATRADDTVVLWGWDAKNYCIVATDGMTIRPVSQPIAKTLRQMSPVRSRQIVAHGAYDAKNRLNCLWLPSQNAGAQVNMLFAQHAPTGQWFIHDDMDVLCSAQFQDGDSNLSKIYVGTETGFMGEAFAEGFYSNWISSGRSSGPIASATGTTITRGDGISFFLDRDGYVGNWCLITDANGSTEQWGRISAVTANKLTFDYIRPAVGGVTTAFNPIPAAGSLFFVGVIECRALKYFDYNQPAEDKKLSEVWLTLDGTWNPKIAGHVGSTFLRYYRERTVDPLAPNADGKTALKLERVAFDDAALTQDWFTQVPPTERIKTFGIEVIDRGFGQWRFYNWTLKAK